MNNWSEQDYRFMATALQLAAKGELTARPNPMVGCVIVKDSRVVGQGWHQSFGEAHAEINALSEAGELAQGATCYVTLEPCSHIGKTGACAVALIQAGVTEVIAAMEDPNPEVCSKGFALLESAGIKTSVGLMESQAKSLNRGFISRFERRRPWVTVKLAMSIDGRTALENGASQWISGSEARNDVQLLRAKQDAIITGIGTQISDNPSLTARVNFSNLADVDQKQFRQPLRVLVDRQARANLSDKFFQKSSSDDNYKDIWWVSQASAASEKLKLSNIKHIDLVKIDQLDVLLKQLSVYGVNNVLVEAGHQLVGGFLKLGLVDELIIYVAPKIMGNKAMALFDYEVVDMQDCPPLELLNIRQIGNDIRLTYQPKKLA